MKKILFLAFALVATASCKRDVDFTNNNPVEPVQGVEIALSAGTGVASSSKTVVADKGEREIFILKDKIGLYAAYKIAVEPARAATFKPDWTVNNETTQTGVYFKNKPAICTEAGVREAVAPFAVTSPAEFGWGLDVLAPGGRDITQTYPRNSKDIYLFAYYPYTASQDAVEIATDGPTIALVLNEVSVVTDPVVAAGEVLIYTGSSFTAQQSDVLYSQAVSAGSSTGVTPPQDADLGYINRLNKLKTLQFNHALAQLNVKISREAGAAQAWLMNLKFKTYSTAKMTLSHEPLKLGGIAPTGEADAVTYTIASEPGGEGFEITSTQKQLIDNHLMVFPLSNTNLANCALEVTVYYASEAPEGEPEDNLRTFTIPLENLKVKPAPDPDPVSASDPAPAFELKAGMLNLIELKLTTADILIEGVITAWDEAGSTGNIVVE